MRCLKCGRELNDMAAFCPTCGTPCLQKPQKNKKTILIVIIILIIIFSIACGIAAPLILKKLSAENKSEAVEISENIGIDETTETTQTEENTENVETNMGVIDYDALLANLGEACDAVVNSWEMLENEMEMEQRIALLGELQQTLDDLRPEAAALATDDAKLQSAVAFYYDLASDYAGIYYDYYDFFKRYNEAPFILSRPDMSDSSRTSLEKYEDMVSWLETAKMAYENFEYPLFVEGYWKEYEDILDLNQTVIDKYVLACNYNDNLRMLSCEELYKRCTTAEDKWFNDVLDSSIDMLNLYCVSSYSYSVKLYREIQEYSEMSEKEKEEYVFVNNMSGEICYDTECVDTIYPSLYNTYDSFAIISLAAYSGQKKIDVEVEIPGFTQKYRQSYTITNEARQLFIKPPLVTGDIDLSAAKSAQINITFYDQDGTQIYTESNPVTIKSKNDVEWYNGDFGIFTQDNILCFLTPESSGVSNLKRSAIDEISKMTSNTLEALVGYQEGHYNRYTMTYLQAASIMRALYNEGVRYSMDGFSVSGSQQHVLLPDQVLEGKQGLCIETSLIVASALQSANMHAFLVFPPGHAQVAVEVWNSGEGCGEYFLIETTALGDDLNGNAFIAYANQLIAENKNAENNSCIQYYDAQGWENYLQGVEYVIDCDDSRILGMTPFAN